MSLFLSIRPSTSRFVGLLLILFLTGACESSSQSRTASDHLPAATTILGSTAPKEPTGPVEFLLPTTPKRLVSQGHIDAADWMLFEYRGNAQQLCYEFAFEEGASTSSRIRCIQDEGISGMALLYGRLSPTTGAPIALVGVIDESITRVRLMRSNSVVQEVTPSAAFDSAVGPLRAIIVLGVPTFDSVAAVDASGKIVELLPSQSLPSI